MFFVVIISIFALSSAWPGTRGYFCTLTSASHIVYLLFGCTVFTLGTRFLDVDNALGFCFGFGLTRGPLSVADHHCLFFERRAGTRSRLGRGGWGRRRLRGCRVLFAFMLLLIELLLSLEAFESLCFTCLSQLLQLSSRGFFYRGMFAFYPTICVMFFVVDGRGLRKFRHVQR